ncbi:MAG: hypothetical protein ABI836_04300 [Gemmatimonadota bacterium]
MQCRQQILLRSTIAGIGLLGACSSGADGPTPIDPGVSCSASTPVNLAVGESVILDATVAKGCIRLPAAGAGGATHLVVAYSGAGQVTRNGVSGPYALGGLQVANPAAPAFASGFSGVAEASPAGRFHAMLRERESELALEPGRRLATPRAPQVPPVFDDQRTFKVCADQHCNGFVNVIATAKFVGPRGAIFIDNTVPPNGLTQEDIDSLGSLFDGASPNIYEIDTTSFSRESDLDGNGVVIVLLTDQVNTISGTCPNGSIILGYFFGLDLISDPNSNHGEIFYGLVPNPTAAHCNITKAQVFRLLPPVLAHEFQHMISFNQHVLIRGGPSEVTWLNEGMSHFAEEVAGRALSDTRCPGFATCLRQFTDEGDLSNGFFYLKTPEDFFLVSPGSSFGRLEERGASWLFVRWLADHFAGDTLLGTSLTRSLEMTTLTGSGNVASVTGQPFKQLVGEWQLANYTESLAGFTGTNGRLRYRTWDLAAAFAAASGGQPYPLVPDVTTGTYSRLGTLRGGSGRHVLVSQAANAGPIDLQLKGDNKFATLVPTFAVVRTQ